MFVFTVYLKLIQTRCRNVADFPKFLGIAMETFLLMCDDKESDVRMAADECLNRTIKVGYLRTNGKRYQFYSLVNK